MITLHFYDRLIQAFISYFGEISDHIHKSELTFVFHLELADVLRLTEERLMSDVFGNLEHYHNSSVPCQGCFKSGDIWLHCKEW